MMKNSQSDVSVFIKDLEISAKKILKDANRKKIEARKHEESLLRKNGGSRKTVNDVVNVGSVLINTKDSQGFSGAQSRILSPDLKVNADDTVLMHYSVPRMLVSVANDAPKPLETQTLRSGSAGSLSPISKSRDNTSSQSPFPNKSVLRPLDKEKIIRRNRVLEKIEASPFLSSSMNSVDILLARRQMRANDETNGPPKETNWALRMRATDILSGKQNSGATRILHEVDSKEKTTTTEPQGPIDWSSQALRVKYRGASQREAAWQAWKHASAYSMQCLEEETGLVLPVAVVDRHPIFALFFKCIHEDNIRSLARSHARLKMKRFVQDVQEVWLSNLKHLREYQSTVAFTEDVPDDALIDTVSDLGSGGGNVLRGGTASDGSNKATAKTAESSNMGLDDRRDSRAILKMSAQIQSVAARRANRKAFHSSRMPEPTVALDYPVRPTPQKQMAPPPPPLLQALVDGVAITWGHLIVGYDPLPAFLFIHRLVPQEEGGDRGRDREPSPSPDASSENESSPSLREGALWRLSILRQEDAAVTALMVSERKVLELLSVAAAAETAQEHREDDEIPLWSSQEPILLTWKREVLEADVALTFLSSNESYLGGQVRVNILVKKLGLRLSKTYAWLKVRALLRLPLDSARDTSAPVAAGGTECEEVLCGSNGGDLCEMISSLIHLKSAAGSSQEPTEIELDKDWESGTVGDSILSSGLSEAQAQTAAWEFLRFMDVSLSASIPPGHGSPFSPSALCPNRQPLLHALMKLERFVIDGLETLPGALMLESRPKPEVPPPIVVIKGPLVVEGSTSCAGKEAVEDWEKQADQLPCSSLVVSGGMARQNVVPGACAVGTAGLWLASSQSADTMSDKDSQNPVPFSKITYAELTQPAALFFRNSRLSSSDTVLVNAVIAFDSPCLVLPVIAWEATSCEPPRSLHDPADGVVPLLAATPHSLRRMPVISMIQERLTPTVGIFTNVAEALVDYQALDKPTLPAGLARAWPTRDSRGFRRSVHVSLLRVDPSLPTLVFGITRVGATCNNTHAHARNVWHSSYLVTDHINRPRTPKDLHFVLKNESSRGANDPAAYTVQLRDGQFYSLSCTAFQQQKEDHDEVLMRRGVFARQLAMETKIESAEVLSS